MKRGTQTHGLFKALPLGGLLSRVAAKLGPNEKAKKKNHRDDIVRQPRKTINRKLTADQVREIRSQFRPRVVTVKMLSEKFSVSIYTIEQVLNGTQYGWVR